MTASPTPSENAPHWARPLYERQIAMAGQLAEAGLAMALTVKDQTEALTQEGAVEPAVLEGLARAYARAARAVRLSLLLQDRLIKDLIAFDNKAALDADWDCRQQTRARKDLAGHVIERVIARSHDDNETVERLACETAERLDREDLYGLVLSRPVSELVAMICHDLNLDPDWSRLAGEAWAKAEAASGEVGWPLAGLTTSNSSPVGGGGPRSGGGGMPDATPLGSAPLRRAAYPQRATSPDGGGMESRVLASP